MRFRGPTPQFIIFMSAVLLFAAVMIILQQAVS